jgi:hypothetical protein
VTKQTRINLSPSLPKFLTFQLSSSYTNPIIFRFQLIHEHGCRNSPGTRSPTFIYTHRNNPLDWLKIRASIHRLLRVASAALPRCVSPWWEGHNHLSHDMDEVVAVSFNPWTLLDKEDPEDPNPRMVKSRTRTCVDHDLELWGIDSGVWQDWFWRLLKSILEVLSNLHPHKTPHRTSSVQ